MLTATLALCLYIIAGAAIAQALGYVESKDGPGIFVSIVFWPFCILLGIGIVIGKGLLGKKVR